MILPAKAVRDLKTKLYLMILLSPKSTNTYLLKADENAIF
jgi:hypothetical protein